MATLVGLAVVVAVPLAVRALRLVAEAWGRREQQALVRSHARRVQAMRPTHQRTK